MNSNAENLLVVRGIKKWIQTICWYYSHLADNRQPYILGLISYEHCNNSLGRFMFIIRLRWATFILSEELGFVAHINMTCNCSQVRARGLTNSIVLAMLSALQTNPLSVPDRGRKREMDLQYQAMLKVRQTDGQTNLTSLCLRGPLLKSFFFSHLIHIFYHLAKYQSPDRKKKKNPWNLTDVWTPCVPPYFSE